MDVMEACECVLCVCGRGVVKQKQGEGVEKSKEQSSVVAELSQAELQL